MLCGNLDLCLDFELSDQCVINFVIRLTAMAAVILMQAWLAWNFICYQIRMWREYAASTATPSKKKDNKKKSKKESEKKKKEEVVAEDSEEADAEEYDKANGSPKAVIKAKKA